MSDNAPTTAPDQNPTVTGDVIELNTSVAHPARVYDYWLGGKDHYAPDRQAGEEVASHNPGILPAVRHNRAFLVRAVRYLVGEAGIRQVLDVGTGLPSANNVHEVAQATAADTRVVYVDNDPIVLVHAHALLTGEPGTVSYINADLREPVTILHRATETLDFELPIAVMLLMTLQFIPDENDPYRIVATLMDAVPSGSYLVLSHPLSDEPNGAANTGTSLYNQRVSTPMTRRSRHEIARFFDGLELLEPGLVPMAQWRPDGTADFPGKISPALCGVARKP